MRILVTNDDGVFAERLWILVNELSKIAQVVVVAPDRERSAIGTAVTLYKPLRVQQVKPLVTGIETYSVEGTPADSVILALEKLVKDKIDLVVSGINHGLNLGNDVLISGTVGAALQGHLRGFPALAVSVSAGENRYIDNAAKVAALLAKKMGSYAPPANVFLNVNIPHLPPTQIKGVKITRLANESHIDTVEEGHDGEQAYYWLERHKLGQDTNSKSDVWALEHSYISITPLYINLPGKNSASITNRLCADLFQELF